MHYVIVMGVNLGFLMLWDGVDFRGRAPGISFRFLTQPNYLMILAIRGALEIVCALVLYSMYDNWISHAEAWRRVALRSGVAAILGWSVGFIGLDVLSRLDSGSRNSHIWRLVEQIERIKDRIVAEEARRSGALLGATGAMAPRGADSRLALWAGLVVAVATMILTAVQVIISWR